MSTANLQPRLYLVQERPNPSTDFFLAPLLAGSRRQTVVAGFDQLPAAEELDGAVVVFVRYLPPAWARLVARVRPSLAKLVLFIDDDVLDTQAGAGLPWLYRLKLWRLAAARLGWLRRQQAELWVSTPYLAQKYAHWPAKLLLPAPVAPPADLCTVFYHGSASHQQEIRWLRPVLAQVLGEHGHLCFEIIGGPAVNALYRTLPRVSVVHPMPWPSYQAFLTLRPRHIGLNPLLPSVFNRARSHSKFFDISQCGAAGIYSPDSAAAAVVSHRHDGLVVRLEPDAWAEAIVELAYDHHLRQTLAHNARLKLAALTEQALKSHPGLLD